MPTAVKGMDARLQGYKQLTDAYLLAVAHRRRGVLATFDRRLRTLAGDVLLRFTRNRTHPVTRNWLRSGRANDSNNLGLEAPSGFEPEMEVLQTSALPLGDGADQMLCGSRSMMPPSLAARARLACQP